MVVFLLETSLHLLDVLLLDKAVDNILEIQEFRFEVIDRFLECHFLCSLCKESDSLVEILFLRFDSSGFGHYFFIFFSQHELSEDEVFGITLDYSGLRSVVC